MTVTANTTNHLKHKKDAMTFSLFFSMKKKEQTEVQTERTNESACYFAVVFELDEGENEPMQ